MERTSPHTGTTSSLVSASEYRISELFGKINPRDKHFLKYLPDEMLSDPQRAAKAEALDEDRRRIASYTQANTKASGESPDKSNAEQAYLDQMERLGYVPPESSENAAHDGATEEGETVTNHASDSKEIGGLHDDTGSGIISAKISAHGRVINPMPEGEYQIIKRHLLSQGIDVFAAVSGDDLRYMLALGAEGTYSSGRITHIGRVPSRGTLYEEMLHLAQAKKYGELNSTDFVELYAREIEANRFLLNNKAHLKLDEIDVQDIVRNLSRWEKLFEETVGESYDQNHYRDDP